MNISKIDIGDSEYNIKDKVARAVTDRMSADGNTLNVGYDTTNFGDAASVGTIIGDVMIDPWRFPKSIKLEFEFISDGVRYAGIETITEYNEIVGNVTMLYYLKDDGSKEPAFDLFAGHEYLSVFIQPVNMTAFLEIYNDNQSLFNAEIAQGVKIGTVILSEKAVDELRSLELIGSFSMMSFESFEQQLSSAYADSPNSDMALIARKARFIDISGTLCLFAPCHRMSEKIANCAVVVDTSDGWPVVSFPVDSTSMGPQTFTFYR